MTARGPAVLVLLALAALGCAERQTPDAKPRYTTAKVMQTSRGGDKLAAVATLEFAEAKGTERPVIALDPATECQSILGMAVSESGFRIIASPWTAPPWMKDNNAWNDGSLEPELYPTWALYFSKYIRAYEEQGIDVWGVTIENEPLGNGGQWESMIFSPTTMAGFLKNHPGPRFDQDADEDKPLHPKYVTLILN